MKKNCTTWQHKKHFSEREIDNSIHEFEVNEKVYTFSRDNELADFIYPAKNINKKIEQIKEDLLAGRILSKTGLWLK